MNHVDVMNFLFGVFASILTYQNVKEAKAHNQIKGMHWYSTAFFTSWASFQMYMYYNIHMYMSMIGNFAILSVDIYWLYLYWSFKKAKPS
jgi:hypothetical protein